MDAAIAAKTRPFFRHAVAGLGAGVFGCILMIGWLMLASRWNHRSIWSVPNLMATTFYGADAYREQWLRSTWSGLALILTIYGSAGLIWGLGWGDKRVPWFFLYGAGAGASVFYLFFHLLWRHANPMITLYSPDRQIVIGHILWGMALTRSARYSRRMADPTVYSG